MLRYQIYWDDQTNPNVAGTLPGLAETIIKKNQNLGFQWTKVWSNNTVQEVRIGWAASATHGCRPTPRTGTRSWASPARPRRR